MSQHHADPVEENIETHPVKLAIAIVIGAVGLVVGIIMLAYFAVGSHRVGAADAGANTPEAIGQRIAPATVLVIDPAKASAPTATLAPKSSGAPVVAPAVPSATLAAAAVGGEGVYKTACAACHATGVAGAPKMGDKGAWGVRVAKGKPLLYEHALKGFNAMPAKGGNAALADTDVKSAVDYMVAQAK